LRTLPKTDQEKKTEEIDDMFQKITKLSFWLVGALLIGFCGIALQAQDAAAPATGTAKAKPAAIKVTGCLQKGDAADEFAITGENGKTWELRSTSVKLGDHVGHTVTITGERRHETKAEEAKEEKSVPKESKEAEAKEAGDLRVTSLDMVSESCKK
jgi:hypothetical protein